MSKPKDNNQTPQTTSAVYNPFGQNNSALPMQQQAQPAHQNQGQPQGLNMNAGEFKPNFNPSANAFVPQVHQPVAQNHFVQQNHHQMQQPQQQYYHNQGQNYNQGGYQPRQNYNNQSSNNYNNYGQHRGQYNQPQGQGYYQPKQQQNQMPMPAQYQMQPQQSAFQQNPVQQNSFTPNAAPFVPGPQAGLSLNSDAPAFTFKADAQPFVPTSFTPSGPANDNPFAAPSFSNLNTNQKDFTPAQVPVQQPKIVVPVKSERELKIEAKLTSLNSDQTKELTEVYTKIQKAEKLSEDLLKDFVNMVKPIKDPKEEDLQKLVSLKLTVAKREPGVAKALNDFPTGNFSKGGNMKKGGAGRGYGDRNNRYQDRGRDGFGRGQRSDLIGSEYGKQGSGNYNDRRRYQDRDDDPSNILVRRERDEMEDKLIQIAKANLENAKKEKDNTQTVRLWLNQISPDNYQKKEGELRVLLFGDRKCKDEEGFEDQEKDFVIDDAKQLVVVQTIFRKAQAEHSYAGFYSELCAQIVRLELLIKGLSPSRKNIKECNFRKSLLNYCRESFEALLATPLTEQKKETEKEEDRLDRELKTKHKLFGNIEFVGELFKQYIVTEQVQQQVFTSLLGIGNVTDSNVNDNTIEAAIKLMTKTGYTMEGRVAESKDKDKKEKLNDQLQAIFDRLQELMTLDEKDPKNRASQRIKILIKNMFSNKETGWAKTKEEKRIQTKDEVARAVLKQDQDKRLQGDRDDDRRGGDRRDNRDNRDDRGGRNDGGRGGKRDDNRNNKPADSKLQYKPKGAPAQTPKGGKGGRFNLDESAMNTKSGKNDRMPQTPKAGSNPRREVQSDEVQRTIRNHYQSLYKTVDEVDEEAGEEETKTPVASFDDIKKFMADTNAQAHDLMYYLLDGVLEDKMELTNAHLPTVIKDICQTRWPLEAGLSRFIETLSDACSDAPMAPEWFFKLVMKPMLESNRIDMKKLNWLQPDDDIFAVGGHIELIAQLLKFRTGSNDLTKAVEDLRKDLGPVMKVLLEKMEENGEDKVELRKRVQELTNFSDKDGQAFEFLGLSSQ